MRIEEYQLKPRKRQGTDARDRSLFLLLAWHRRTMWSWSTVALIAACGAEPAGEEPVQAPCPQSIIHGTPAFDSVFDAIGSLGMLDSAGVFHPTCSGALIATDVVLTAKHCTMNRNGEPLLPGNGFFFALGPDASEPLAIVRVTSVELSAPYDGGVTELGSDVAVCRLERHITEIVPLRLAATRTSDDLVGSTLATFGYGTDNAGCDPSAAFRPIRRMATETLRAVRGNAFDTIYGSYSAYLAHALGNLDLSTAANRYEHGVLLEGYEVWAEAGPSESQSCHGDSGGPVTLEQNGGMEILGVTSWSWSSETQACDFGAVVAVFGPETVNLLDAALGKAE